VFFVSQLILAVCLLLPLWVVSKPGALVLIASCGISWTAVMIFPFTVVAMSVEEQECGLYMGVLNIFVVMPQIFVSLVIGTVIDHFGGLEAAFVLGSISALISAFCVWTLILKEKNPEDVINITNGGH